MNHADMYQTDGCCVGDPITVQLPVQNLLKRALAVSNLPQVPHHCGWRSVQVPGAGDVLLAAGVNYKLHTGECEVYDDARVQKHTFLNTRRG